MRCSSKKVFLFKIELPTNFQKMSTSYNNLRNTFLINFVFFTDPFDFFCIKISIAKRASLLCMEKNLVKINISIFNFHKRCSFPDFSHLDERDSIS